MGAEIVQEMLRAENWNSPLIFTAIGTLAALVAAWSAYIPIKNQKKAQRILERDFGAELFGSDVIRRSTKYYVPPDCSSVDPSGEAEIRHVVTARQELYEVVDHFLGESATGRHLLLLADSGMGKTSFVLNYYARNQQRNSTDRHRIAVVPLGVPDADDYISSIEAKRETVIFLDAFDEDTMAIEDHRSRLHELMQATRNFKRVVLTSRTQFFPTDEETPLETGIARVGPRRAGERAIWEFWKLYLLPLDDQAVEKFISKRYSIYQPRSRRRARRLAAKVPLLSIRPMLLAAIPDLLESNAELRTQSDIYEEMIESWLERESSWVNRDSLRSFSRKFAIDIFTNRITRGAERVPMSELLALAEQWEVPLERWQITGRSLLNRDAAGNFKFAHRSIMEYIVAKELHDSEEHVALRDLSDQIRLFFAELAGGSRALTQQIRLEEVSTMSKDTPFWLKQELRKVDGYRYVDLPPEVYSPTSQQVSFHTPQPGLSRWHVWPEAESRLVQDLSSDLTWLALEDGSPCTIGTAEQSARRYNEQGIGGYKDWRLPSIVELAYLLAQKSLPSPSLRLTNAGAYFWLNYRQPLSSHVNLEQFQMSSSILGDPAAAWQLLAAKWRTSKGQQLPAPSHPLQFRSAVRFGDARKGSPAAIRKFFLETVPGTAFDFGILEYRSSRPPVSLLAATSQSRGALSIPRLDGLFAVIHSDLKEVKNVALLVRGEFVPVYGAETSLVEPEQ